jgi:hypothetical protein
MPNRESEVDAIRRRVEAIGEKDPDGGYWLELTCAKELGIATYERVWIHTKRSEKFVRFEKKGGKRGFNRRGVLLGVKGQPRMVRAHIGGVKISRHRAIALAAGIMTLEQYRDTKNFVIDHFEPRKPDEVPDDRPENLRVVSQSANLRNPKNKKRGHGALAKPVTLTRKSTGVQTPFPSARAAAKFIGVNPGNLNNYLNMKKGSQMNMPEGKGVEWEAAWTKVEGFECADAVPIPGVHGDDERRISPTKGLLRAVGGGKYALSANVTTAYGYLRTRIGGKNVNLHRLVFKTFAPSEFAAELAKLPPGTDERKLDVDHIDGDKLNNALANLRAVDRSTHSSKHSAAIDWVDGDWVLGTYDTAADAAREVRGTDGKPLERSNILGVCKKKYPHTGGRQFAYVDADHSKYLLAASARKKRKVDAVYEAV